ncbi:MAG TPA: hypothetical protein VEA69_19620 [Tepidisphaeraceae bacterium]|nr:hypothetical protein [Tepidisphaeraceae bacterium]
MRKLFPALAILVVAAVATSPAAAYPKPAVNKTAWELDVQTSAPIRIAVKAPGDSAPKAYWYMLMTVTNNTGEEQQFLPEVELVDDKGNVFRSDKSIPQAVFDQIKQVTGKKLLVPLGKASGPIRQGPDEAVDTVAIWPEPLERMGSFTVFVSGLSGESLWYDAKNRRELRMGPLGTSGRLTWHKDGVPMKDPNDAEGKKFLQVDWTEIKPTEIGEMLRKTLQLDYQVPGDEFYAGKDVIIQKAKTWVMR